MRATKRGTALDYVRCATFASLPEAVADPAEAGRPAFRDTALRPSSHPVDRAGLEQRLCMVGQTSAGATRPLEYEIEYGPHDRRAHPRSEIVAIGEQAYFVRIEFAAGLEPARGDGVLRAPRSAQARVPDRTSYFRVDEFDTRIVEDGTDRALQTAVFGFTDRVDTAEFTACGQQVRVRSRPAPAGCQESSRSPIWWKSWKGAG